MGKVLSVVKRANGLNEAAHLFAAIFLHESVAVNAQEAARTGLAL